MKNNGPTLTNTKRKANFKTTPLHQKVVSFGVFWYDSDNRNTKEIIMILQKHYRQFAVKITHRIKLRDGISWPKITGFIS